MTDSVWVRYAQRACRCRPLFVCPFCRRWLPGRAYPRKAPLVRQRRNQIHAITTPTMKGPR